MKQINFNMPLEFSENNEGTFEGILVNYNHDTLAHGVYKFLQGSMKVNEGKTLLVLYNHENKNIPVGTMVGIDTPDGFKVTAKFNLEKDEGGYINKAAASLYNLMKSGANFELSVGGFLNKYSEKKDNNRRFIEITQFDAYEGSITPRGAVKGSVVTNVFNENIEEEKMTREEMNQLFAEYTQQIISATTDKELKELPTKFEELKKKMENFADKEEFNAKMEEFNEIIKELKVNGGQADEYTDEECFAAMFKEVYNKNMPMTFTKDTPINFATISSAGTTQGGSLDKIVKPWYVNKIIPRLQAINPILKYVPFINIDDNSLYLPIEDTGLPAVGWVNETETRNATNITNIKNTEIKLHQFYALPKISNRLMATNFVNYASFLMNRLETSFAVGLADAILNGSGSGQPKGILQNTDVLGAKKTIDTSSDDKFVDSLIDAYYSVRSEIAANAVWFMTRGTWCAISKLKNTSKDFYITDLNTGNMRTLMGRPVELIDSEGAGLKDIATATADTDPVILFADLSKAVQGVVNNNLDIKIKDNITEKGTTIFYIEKLIGAGVVLPEYALLLEKKS